METTRGSGSPARADRSNHAAPTEQGPNGIQLAEDRSGSLSAIEKLSWEGLLACPQCNAALHQAGSELRCAECAMSWPILNDIPTFIDSFPYWGEIPQQEMAAVNAAARNGNWKQAVLDSTERSVQTASEMILNVDRANWHYFLEGASGGRVLDLGAGMGTNSHALSSHFDEVVAVEPVRERVEFMQDRFSQEGLKNIRIVRTSIWDLPFADDTFDLVAMNGVLEWVAAGRQGDPEEIQLSALKNVLRILKPGGSLYLGIENRYVPGYFIGYPDPHCGLPFLTVLPRKLAQLYAKFRGWPPYRNYLYSRRGYRKLLWRCGFEEFRCFAALPSYNHPRHLVPLEGNAFSYFAQNLSGSRAPVRKILRTVLLKLGLLKDLEYSFAIFVRKPSNAYPTVGKSAVAAPAQTENKKPERIGPELKTFLLAHANKWGIRRHADWNFLLFNNYQPSGTTVVLFWFQGENNSPDFVTKVFYNRALAEQEYRNLETAYGCCPAVAPKPLCIEDNGRISAVWMTGVPGAPKDLRSSNATALENLVDLVASVHRALVQSFESTPDDRYRRLVLDPLQSLQHAGASKGTIAGYFQLRNSVTPEWLDMQPRIPQHGDLSGNNLLFARGQWHIVDWEYFGRVDLPMFDVVTLMASVFCSRANPGIHDSILKTPISRLIQRYADSMMLTREQTALLIPLALLNWFHLQYSLGHKQFSAWFLPVVEDYFSRTDGWKRVFCWPAPDFSGPPQQTSGNSNDSRRTESKRG